MAPTLGPGARPRQRNGQQSGALGRASLGEKPPGANKNRTQREFPLMRSVIFLILGVPIPIILLVAMCTHHL